MTVCNQQPFHDRQFATLGLAGQNTCSPRGLRSLLVVVAAGGQRSYQVRTMRPSSYGRKTRMASGYTDTACTRTRCLGIVDLPDIVVILLLQPQVSCLSTTTSLCKTLAHSNIYSQTASRSKRWLKPMAWHRSRTRSFKQTSTRYNPRMRRGSCKPSPPRPLKPRCRPRHRLLPWHNKLLLPLRILQRCNPP